MLMLFQTRWMMPLLLAVAGSVLAVEDIRLGMEVLRGESWQGRGLLVELLDVGGGHFSLMAGLEELSVGEGRFEGIRLNCDSVEPGATGDMECAAGRLEVADSPAGRLQADVSWQYGHGENWQLSLEPLRLKNGELRLQASRHAGRLAVDFSVKQLPLDWLQPWLPRNWTVSGSLRGKGHVRLDANGFPSFRFSGTLAGLSWSSEDGLQVGEDVTLDFSLRASGQASRWQGELEASVAAGQLYSDPVFVAAGPDFPLALSGSFQVDRSGRRLGATGLHLAFANALEIRGDLDIDLVSGRPHSLALDFSLADLRQAYEVLLQPLAIGTPMDDLSLKGRAQGSLRMDHGSLSSATMVLQQVDLEHNGGMFGISGLQADLNWRQQGEVEFSHLAWQTAHLYRIASGATEALFKARGGQLQLQPLSMPLLGGRLLLHDLEMTGMLEGRLAWETRADLNDIQLLELSRAMGWPDMQGSLQASIPRVHYRDSVLRMQGQLRLDVFGGEVVMEGLELQEPLGVAPVLQTSLRFSNLDLEQITQVFSFGRIEGSLEGYVRGLQLVGWEVAAFDASLQSPPHDKRPHRISQRAIDNLTELGNGASVQLSATMLRFFEDFAYDSLALKVRLRGTTAELDGVPRPQGGYYIVKGARLPRIDVIGRNHRIAWKELLSRIRDIRFDDMIVE